MQWNILQAQQPATHTEIEALLLENRGITDAKNFYNPQHPTTLTPSGVGIDQTSIEKTVERIKTAIANSEKIVVYGDYDADGICATTILWKTLHSMKANVVPFIPDREKHGYGISERSIPDIEKLEPALIITVDNGIVAHKPLGILTAKGIECIVTDHHQPEIDANGDDVMPAVFAVVHTTQLCGSTVAWMLSYLLHPEYARDLLDLCAIASIADQVQLKDANRAFVFHGLEALRTTTRVGVQELCTVAGVKQREITSGTVGFQLAPRINAMGRIAQGMDALRLLCTDNPQKAQSLAQVLQQTNTNRQELTTDMFEDALEQATAQKDQHILVVSSEYYHEGVIGLIAGKLTERFYKPAIAISFNTLTAKASARSVKGVNIIEMLRLVRDDLLEVGGHQLAGGFSLETNKIELVKKRLHDLAKTTVTAEQLLPFIDVDCELPLQLVTTQLTDILEKLEPCGQGNPHPLFVLRDVKVKGIQSVGKEGQHRKLHLCLQNPANPLDQMIQVPGLYWNVPEALQIREGDVISLAITVSKNVYKGRTTVQVIIKDIHIGE